MPTRSQRHLREFQGYDSSGQGGGGVAPGNPPITGIYPDVATIAGVGAVGRLIATLSTSGGTGIKTFTLIGAVGLTVKIVPANNTLITDADPVGAPGIHEVTIQADDELGETLTEILTVTVT
jgi:hypothetical protein